ncbi:MAG: transposase IS204/IS1001/IS1096/IS1165 family protein, partial [bacterium P201]
KYMCVIADHYTREVLAVFDSRYGREILDWLRSHPEIKVVTRDGSRSYASIISAASERITQVSDRFHLMQKLKKDAVEPKRTLLGQTKAKQPYPYPSEDEAYRYIMDAILGMGDARHRSRVRTYYDVRRLKDEGRSVAETARMPGIRSQKVYQALATDMSRVLSREQRQALKVAREMAGIISGGCITYTSVAKRLQGKAEPRIVHRCMMSISERYKVLRDEVRTRNKALGEKGRTVKVKASAIWKYIVTGEADSKKLLRLHETYPETGQLIQICIRFRKMLHGEDDAPALDDWLKEAGKCRLKEIRDFAEYVRNDKEAVRMACETRFNNGLLEGKVNKAKAIKRSMYNRAGPEVLRAKMIFDGMKWDWNYHPN